MDLGASPFGLILGALAVVALAAIGRGSGQKVWWVVAAVMAILTLLASPWGGPQNETTFQTQQAVGLFAPLTLLLAVAYARRTHSAQRRGI